MIILCELPTTIKPTKKEEKTLKTKTENKVQTKTKTGDENKNRLLIMFLTICLLLFYSLPVTAQSITLITIGDSLTAGDGDNSSAGGYPGRLINMLAPLYPGSTVQNLAISGDTTQDLINKQLDTAVASLTTAPAGNLKIVTVWVGSNDLFGLYASDVCSEYYSNLATCEEVEMGISKNNINTILTKLKATGATIYIAVLDDQTKRPIIKNASLRNEVFPGITEDEIPRMSAQILSYNEQIKTDAATNGAYVVDFFNTTIFENSATLDYDGNHPNSAGYDAIAQIWYQAITKNDIPDIPIEDKDPVLSISSGDNYDTVSVDTNENIPISVSVDAGKMLDQPGELWLVYVTPDNKIFSMNSSFIWVEGLTPVLSMPLFSFNSIPVFSSSFSISGAYTFYFAFDDKVDGVPAAPIWLDMLTVNVSSQPPVGNTRLMPENLVYQGAFSFPDGDEWTYSGQALAFYPDGNSTGPDNGYAGSLYTATHVYNKYAGEITIPAPSKAKIVTELPKARVILPPTDITGNWKDNCTFNDECIYRELDGLVYLPNINKIAWNLRDWYNTARYDQDSLGWSNLDMTDPQGVWHIGPRNNDIFHNAKTGNYLFKAPELFAKNFLGNKWLIAGASREAGALGGSQGPTLFALAPWEDGNPPASSSNLDALALLYYPEIYDCAWVNQDVCAYPNYTAADHWNGGAWIETASKTAVLITGRKGMGEMCYGTPEECGDDPCVTSKGYHAYPYQPQILFYDPEDLKKVVSKTKEPWQVLPYQILNLEDITYNAGCAVIGAAAWDPAGKNLYITEKEIDNTEHGAYGVTVVHVWKVL